MFQKKSSMGFIVRARKDGADISFHIGRRWNLIKDYSVKSDEEAAPTSKNADFMVREAGDDKQEDQATRERVGSATVCPASSKRQNTKRPREAPASAPAAKRPREDPASYPTAKRPREDSADESLAQ